MPMHFREHLRAFHDLAERHRPASVDIKSPRAYKNVCFKILEAMIACFKLHLDDCVNQP